MSRSMTTGFRAFALGLATSLAAGGGAVADVVHFDDVIIDGSLCVGLDCVDGESFSFSTIRLKENNTRIDFIDTSVSASFPTRDWRIEANSAANGGASYIALKDMGNTHNGTEGGTPILQLTAGAPSNSIFVDSGGRVGFRTSTPSVELHTRDGDTPTLRLQQDGSNGFAPQTWDIAGNETNFFIRDVTNSSTLPFRIRPGAPSSSIEIDPSGNVGVGRASPVSGNGNVERILQVHASDNNSVVNISTGAPNGSTGGGILEVMGTGRGGNNKLGQISFQLDGTTGLGASMRLATHDGAAFAERMRIASNGDVGIGTGAPAAQLHTTGTVRFAGVANCGAGIQSDANGTLACLASTRSLKTIAGVLEPEAALANVMALRPHVGAYKATPDVPEHWLIAEDVANVEPALVGLRDGAPYVVKTYGVVADLVAVIQHQQKRIEALEQTLGRPEH